jgi:hypothetical protein
MLSDLWMQLTAWTPSPGQWKLTDRRKQHIRARVKQHGEDAVRDVAAWVRTSNHERADFLRKRGDVDTLLRDEKFSTYLAFARSVEVKPVHNGRKPGEETPKVDRSEKPKTLFGTMLKEMHHDHATG